MQLTEIGLALLALGIVLQLLFGQNVAFITGDVTGNIMGLVAELGGAGVIGLVAIAIILHLLGKRA
ncbi:MAG: hypothetical protein CMM46_17275 [Rhodospirillaceae bacterium]|nr:hypothetical protein [Rhodospirillaceae bacterium]